MTRPSPAPAVHDTSLSPLPAAVGGATGAAASYKHLGECVGAGAGDEWLRWVEGDRVDRLVKLLAVRRDLLHTRLVVDVPQPDGAVVTCGQTGAVYSTPYTHRRAPSTLHRTHTNGRRPHYTIHTQTGTIYTTLHCTYRWVPSTQHCTHTDGRRLHYTVRTDGRRLHNAVHTHTHRQAPSTLHCTHRQAPSIQHCTHRRAPSTLHCTQRRASSTLYHTHTQSSDRHRLHCTY